MREGRQEVPRIQRGLWLCQPQGCEPQLEDDENVPVERPKGPETKGWLGRLGIKHHPAHKANVVPQTEQLRLQIVIAGSLQAVSDDSPKAEIKQWVQRNHPSTWHYPMDGFSDYTAPNNFNLQMLIAESFQQRTCVNHCKGRTYTVGPKEPTFNMALSRGRFVRLRSTEQLRLQMAIAGSFQLRTCVDHCVT